MNTEQVKAIIQMVATLAIALAGIFGYSLAEEQAQQVAIVIAAVVVVAFSVWKNCNLTKKAGTAQKALDAMKSGELDQEEVEKLVATGKHVKEN